MRFINFCAEVPSLPSTLVTQFHVSPTHTASREGCSGWGSRGGWQGRRWRRACDAAARLGGGTLDRVQQAHDVLPAALEGPAAAALAQRGAVLNLPHDAVDETQAVQLATAEDLDRHLRTRARVHALVHARGEPGADALAHEVPAQQLLARSGLVEPPLWMQGAASEYSVTLNSAQVHQAGNRHRPEGNQYCPPPPNHPKRWSL